MNFKTLDAKIEQTGKSEQTRGIEHSETIASPLLFTRPDATPSFIHDTFIDFFLAELFIEEINSGNLSVEDAYRKFWSYEEDNELWKLDSNTEYRAFLSSWEKILLWIAPSLKQEKAEELVDIGIKPFKQFIETYWNKQYLHFDYNEQKRYYNPFLEQLVFTCRIAGVSNISEDKHKDISKITQEVARKTRDYLNLLQRLFSALAFTKSESSFDVLEEYFLGYQLNLLDAGPDGPMIFYTTLIYPMLRVINTPRARELIQKFPHSKACRDTGGHLDVDFLDSFDYEQSMRDGWDGESTISSYSYNTDRLRQTIQEWISHDYNYDDIKNAHRLLKPLGYNPKIKLLDNITISQ